MKAIPQEVVREFSAEMLSVLESKRKQFGELVIPEHPIEIIEAAKTQFGRMLAGVKDGNKEKAAKHAIHTANYMAMIWAGSVEHTPEIVQESTIEVGPVEITGECVNGEGAA